MANKGNILRVGEMLNPGDYLVSSLNTFFAVMQNDGNFCVYEGYEPDKHQGRCLFSMHDRYSIKLQPPSYAIMQGDGNFVVYHGTPQNHSGVFGIEKLALIEIPIKPNWLRSYAIMEDSGNFAVYRAASKNPKAPAPEALIWETGTACMEIKPLTFAFMNDLHLNNETTYYMAAKQVIDSLKMLGNYKWPIELGGDDFKVDAIFANGDLTNWGGGDPQPWSRTTTVIESLNSLFRINPRNPDATIVPAYLGIGNHDEADYDFIGNPDKRRQLMWGLIADYHAQYKIMHEFKNDEMHIPIYPATYIDAPTATIDDTVFWRSSSYNYVMDYAPVSVFQLHKHGGDTYHGRAGGFAWIRGQLERIGIRKPIIIQQHYGWDSVSTDGHDPGASWTEREWGPLLNLLRPYNVVGFFHGHQHTPRLFHYTKEYNGKTFNIFHPGSVKPDGWDGQGFGICRVGLDGKIDVLFLQSSDLVGKRQKEPLTVSNPRQIYTTRVVVG